MLKPKSRILKSDLKRENYWMKFNKFLFICVFNRLHKQVFLAGRTHKVERFSFELKIISSSPNTDIQVMSASASRYFTPKQ